MKTALFFKLLFVCLACVAIRPVSAQVLGAGVFELKGQVVDSLTNEPVSFATLRVTRGEEITEPLALLACDIDGYFSVSLPEAGSYYFHMSSIGKIPARRKVSVSAQSPVWNVGKLYMKDDARTLGEVRVSAQRPLVKVDIDKLVYNLEEDPEAKVSNTLDMLRKVPMVTVDGDDNIQLKGNSNFKIYMNGRPSGLLSSNPSAVLKSLPASSIKDIEVITDPGARYDAEGVSGIINIIMVRRVLDGYTGTVSAEVTANEAYGGGTFVSLKAGKLGLTANYNLEYEREPIADITSFRENLSDDANRYLSQIGEHWEREKMHRGYLEGTFEIDSMNLISVDANLFRKRQKEFSDLSVEMRDMNRDLIYAYDRFSQNQPVFGSVEVNANYQHETRRKGELLTLSYRFTNDPNDDENRMRITGTSNYSDFLQWDTNRAKTNEHTGQLDYIRPIAGGHDLETGVKYILRQTDSEITQRLYDETSGNWHEPSGSFVDFSHTQHIYSVYLGGTFRWNKLGIKAGVRAEGTSLDVSYSNDLTKDFHSNFVDIVPNVTLSYSIGQSQQIRLGYNMRIQRAGIDYLNPYVDERDPLNVSYGNPDLDSEKSNSVNLNYTLFTQKFNINASVSHAFVNNSIEQYTFMDTERPNVSVSTYGNIGKRHQTGFSLYMNWSPVPLFRFFMNGGVDYISMENEERNLSNRGWSGRAFAGVQFSFPKDFRLNMNAGYMLPKIQLQGKRSDFLFHGITLNKDFFHKKLTFSVYCKSPLMKTWKMENKTYNNAFTLYETENKVMREFGISVSYRFGSLTDTFRKIKRGIVNDDVKDCGGKDVD